MYNIGHGRNCVEIVVTSAISTAISTSFHCCACSNRRLNVSLSSSVNHRSRRSTWSGKSMYVIRPFSANRTDTGLLLLLLLLSAVAPVDSLSLASLHDESDGDDNLQWLGKFTRRVPSSQLPIEDLAIIIYLLGMHL